jgi:hypothetical protein
MNVLMRNLIVIVQGEEAVSHLRWLLGWIELGLKKG